MFIYASINRTIDIEPDDVEVNILGNDSVILYLKDGEGYVYITFETLYETEKLFKRVLKIIKNEFKLREISQRDKNGPI